jgi:hypothetical protein
LTTRRYGEQLLDWPTEGRVVLAQYDEGSVVVYQAYRVSIAEHAVAHQSFGGPDFSYSRMSWVKTNFLWMMYRSGWATKPGQERVLALRLRRPYFDGLLAAAVWSSHRPEDGTREEWSASGKRSDVRLQWDPDHDPSGAPVARRAIQLGIRGPTLEGFRGEAIVSIEDITGFVAEQRLNATSAPWPHLVTPAEREYPVADPAVRERLGLLPRSA